MASVPPTDDEAPLEALPTYYQNRAAVLASYVPADVVLTAAAIPRPPSEPSMDEFDCAVAFVDISGFTALSERLKKESGKAGAELLAVYVNSYLERLIRGVSLYYGDVIKFAGDALQVVWRDSAVLDSYTAGQLSSEALVRQLARENLSDADSMATNGPAWEALVRAPGMTRHVMQACRCCLYLLNNLNNFSPVEGVQLTLHMGIGAGKLSSFTVGGDNGKWEYFIAGEPIQQMSDATETASSGQLVLSPPAFEALNMLEASFEIAKERLESQEVLLTAITPREPLTDRLTEVLSEVVETSRRSVLNILGATREVTREASKAAREKTREASKATREASKAAREATSKTTSALREASRPTSRLGSIFTSGDKDAAAEEEGPAVAEEEMEAEGILFDLSRVITPSLIDALAAFVPESVEQRLTAGQSGNTISEYRKLTTVFMKVCHER